MKKITFFINSLSSGGAEHQLVELANGLVERGFDVSIVTFGDEQDHYSCSPSIKRIILAHNKNKVIKLLSIWAYFWAVKTDWVISFGQRENKYCLMPLLFRSNSKIHVIAGERNTTISKPSKQERLLLNYLYQRSDYIVPNSHAQRNHIIQTKPKLTKKTVTITNYTDLTRYHALPLPFDEIIRIGIFARYNTQKNCIRFVEAIRLLKEKTYIRFIVEWYGNQRFKDKQPNPQYINMKKEVEKNGLQECLDLRNLIKDVPSVMQRFDAICLPSLWEGFSNSISEAICCGKPMLVSDVADNSVMVKDGINGFLFDPKDESSIVSAFIKFFALSKEEKQQMGIASRKRAEELFDREKFLDSYENLINSKK